jgi:hypothetical protein
MQRQSESDRLLQLQQESRERYNNVPERFVAKTTAPKTEPVKVVKPARIIEAVYPPIIKPPKPEPKKFVHKPMFTPPVIEEDRPKEPRKRPPAVYDNSKSLYGIER